MSAMSMCPGAVQVNPTFSLITLYSFCTLSVWLRASLSMLSSFDICSSTPAMSNCLARTCAQQHRHHKDVDELPLHHHNQVVGMRYCCFQCTRCIGPLHATLERAELGWFDTPKRLGPVGHAEVLQGALLVIC